MQRQGSMEASRRHTAYPAQAIARWDDDEVREYSDHMREARGHLLGIGIESTGQARYAVDQIDKALVRLTKARRLAVLRT
jgi:hypothetical protein